MSWVQRVKAHGENAQRKSRPRKPQPIVQETWAQVRPQSDNDPGEVLPVFYIIEEGVLTVTDRKGIPVKNIKARTLLLSDNPALLACLLIYDAAAEGE
jgi:hypothetical protein